MKNTRPPSAQEQRDAGGMSRRGLLRAAAAVAPGAFLGCGSEGEELGPESLFQHGVASGDPRPDSVILWTRVTPTSSDPMLVEWELSADPTFPTLAALAGSGTTLTGAERDFTVKVDADGLQPGQTYYYRFRAQDRLSPVGRTRTAPQGATTRARFGVVSCSSYDQGYFHAYRAVARRLDLDAVIHLGDYIYESGPGQFGGDRAVEPPRETITLADYRMRHAHYKRDPDLQEVHRQHPFICVWDDHEAANNSWKDGAVNHQGNEGSWADRKAAAQRAYAEWMPIREQSDPARIWRKLAWGDLADLILLDTRMWGRTTTSGALVGAVPAEDPAVTLLGDDQAEWLEEQVGGSTARWKLIGQQVMVANLNLSSTTIVNPDQWHAYPASRRRLLQFLGTTAPGNVVILTGDLHTSWANELAIDPTDPAQYDPANARFGVAVEFVTPGITSPGLPPMYLPIVEQARPFNPHLRWFDLVRQGYLVLDVVPDRVQAAWFLYDTIKMPGVAAETFAGAWSVPAGSTRLQQEADPAAPPEQVPPAAP
jgi:alkaline phosphatase D